MVRKTLFALAAVLFLFSFSAAPVQGQTLSDIFVSPVGNVLGTLTFFDPGFPAYVNVHGSGLLVWIEMELPTSIIEVYSYGAIRLVEAEGNADIVYDANGLISEIEGIPFTYEDGRVVSIGSIPFEYEFGRLIRVGDVPFLYDPNGPLIQIGGINLEYQDERIVRAADLPFEYDSNGRIRNVAGVEFNYEYGTLKEIVGKIPDLSVTVTWVVEFRKKLNRT